MAEDFQGQVNALAYNRSESHLTQRRQGAKENRETTTDEHGWTRIRGEAPMDDQGFSLCPSVHSVVKNAVGFKTRRHFRAQKKGTPRGVPFRKANV